MGGKAGKSQVREVCSLWSDCVCLAGIFAHFLLAGFLALPSAISDISSQWHWYHTRPGTTAQNETSQPLPPPPCESGLASLVWRLHLASSGLTCLQVNLVQLPLLKATLAPYSCQISRLHQVKIISWKAKGCLKRIYF